MNLSATRIPYRQTNAFSKIAMDYIDQAAGLKPFYAAPPSMEGIKKAIEARKQFGTKRKILVGELKKQYTSITGSKKTNDNIELLLQENTFTITTAHQNNIFTGPLYFIYKILHAIRLAESLKSSLPEYNFIPVYYIGSEDADLDELNHIYLADQKLVWNTSQTGAVGRMKIDKGLLQLIELMQGQLLVEPHGNEIIAVLKECYKEGKAIQQATFEFVNFLFADYGLVILLPDNAVLKQQVASVFSDDLLHQHASAIVAQTAEALQQSGYKVQANPREINLFYLKDNRRDRIEKTNNKWTVINGEESFSEKELLQELEIHPERFSPNVILRGLYQETILPNIAFIGGGGETAYWLQLKNLFAHFKVPFPVLVLRNSFLFIENSWQQKIAKLGFNPEDFFLQQEELMKKIVEKESNNKTKLNGSLVDLETMYELFKKQASDIDSTLEKHVEALKVNAVYRLQELEKKMLRAEKRKFADQYRQIATIKNHLFPSNGLQERVENISFYYARFGRDIIQQLYTHSLSLEQEFVLLTTKE